MEKRTLLVTGASGHLGRRVVELLLEAQAGRVIATTRDPHKLADLAEQGAIVRQADFDHPESLPEAFRGADRLLLVSTDAIDRPGRRLAQHRAALDAAQRAGVRHIMYTSMQAAAYRTGGADHEATEQALAASHTSWTVLRNNLYTEFLLVLLPPAVAQGKLVAAAAEGGAAFVTREDCAWAAAAQFASSDTTSRAIEITGPAVVSFREVTRLASALTGRAVSYVPVEPATLRAQLVSARVPESVADRLVSLHVGIAQGKLGPATSAVAELTGRIPMSVGQFLSAHRNALPPRD